MYSTWLWSTFWDFSNFHKLKRGDQIFGENQFCRKSELFDPPLLSFNFKSFKDPNSSSFIRFQCNLHDSGIPFSNFWNLYKLKPGTEFLGGNQSWRKSESFGTPFCISVLKVSRTQILCHSLDFHAFCMIEEYLSQILWNFYKLKRGPNFLGNQFCRKSELFGGPPFCIWILKYSNTHILCHSLNFNAFFMIHKKFFRLFKFLQIKQRGT